MVGWRGLDWEMRQQFFCQPVVGQVGDQGHQRWNGNWYKGAKSLIPTETSGFRAYKVNGGRTRSLLC